MFSYDFFASVWLYFSHFSWIRLCYAAVTNNINNLSIAFKYQIGFT